MPHISEGDCTLDDAPLKSLLLYSEWDLCILYVFIKLFFWELVYLVTAQIQVAHIN